MAIFTADGKLQAIETTDLIALLSTLDESACIDMQNIYSCLGARAAMHALTLAGACEDGTFTSHGVSYGTVHLKADHYDYDTSLAVAEFIGMMMRKQHNEEAESIMAGRLARELDTYINTVVFDNGWQEAL